MKMLISDLLELEKSTDEYRIWLVNFLRKEMVNATEELLDYFSEIVKQELEIKRDEWFMCPDEVMERKDMLEEMMRNIRQLKEYGVDTSRIRFSKNNCDYMIEDLIKEAQVLDKEIFDEICLLLKSEVKKMEIIKQTNLIKNNKKYKNVQDEEDKSKKKRPEYWKIDAVDRRIYSKIPKIMNNILLDNYIFTEKESAIIQMIDGKNRIEDLVSKSPLGLDTINLIVYLKLENVLDY